MINEDENKFDWYNFNSSNIRNRLIESWESMLSDKSLKEESYHSFLARNPGIFLTGSKSYFVISKLKIAANYITDFVVVNEGYSDGTKYELIEIESPHSRLFDNSGKMTSKFNSAIQQINDWERYLISDKNFFRKTFPTVNTKVVRDSKIQFKIIIGRRSDNQEDLEKRSQIGRKNNVEIISFDRLTDYARRKLHTEYPGIYSSEMKDISDVKKNQLANPFYVCSSDSEWRKICSKGHAHFYPHMIDEILESRSYNNSFEEFKNEMGFGNV